MSEERIVETTAQQGDEFRAFSGGTEVRHRRVKIDRGTVEVHIDEFGQALPDHSGTILNGVAIGELVTGIRLNSRVGQATEIVISMLALPAEIEVMGTVELDVREPIL